MRLHFNSSHIMTYYDLRTDNNVKQFQLGEDHSCNSWNITHDVSCTCLLAYRTKFKNKEDTNPVLRKKSSIYDPSTRPDCP